MVKKKEDNIQGNAEARWKREVLVLVYDPAVSNFLHLVTSQPFLNIGISFCFSFFEIPSIIWSKFLSFYLNNFELGLLLNSPRSWIQKVSLMAPTVKMAATGPPWHALSHEEPFCQ